MGNDNIIIGEYTEFTYDHRDSSLKSDERWEESGEGLFIQHPNESLPGRLIPHEEVPEEIAKLRDAHETIKFYKGGRRIFFTSKIWE